MRNRVLCALVLLITAGPVWAQLYWTDSIRNGSGVTSTSLMRANLDGTAIHTVITQGAGADKFGGIGLDPVGAKLYSGDLASLFRANLDGSGRTSLVPTAGHQVADIALDLPHGKIYWSDYSNIDTHVWWANLDGSLAAPLATFNNSQVEGVAVDSAGGHVYFTLNGNIGNDTVQRMNLDGSGRIPCADFGSTGANPFDVEVDLARSLLYTSLPNSGSILKANMDCSGSPSLVFSPTNGVFNGFHYDPAQDAFYVWGAVATQIDRYGPGGTGPVTLVTGRTFGNYINTTVPEPGALALSLFALGLLGARARRRL